ncbi:hypothetical protein ElyMa_005841700, partial [Elysia marginata]
MQVKSGVTEVGVLVLISLAVLISLLKDLEALTLHLGKTHHFGDILRLDLSFNSDLRNVQCFIRLEIQGEVVRWCEVPFTRCKAVKEHKISFQPGKGEDTFVTVELPTDLYFSQIYPNGSEAQRQSSGFVEVNCPRLRLIKTKTFVLEEPKVNVDLLSMEVGIYSTPSDKKGNIESIVAQLDSIAASVQWSERLYIQVENPLSNYSYKMELARIVQAKVTRDCPVDTMGGEIDLSTLNSHDSPLHCPVALETSRLVVEPYMMSFGLIMLTVNVRDTRNALFQKRGYFKVKNDQSWLVPFSEHTRPSADEFSVSYSGKVGFTLNFHDSYFLYQLPSFGHHKDFLTTPRVFFDCRGNDAWDVCGKAVTSPDGYSFFVDAATIRDGTTSGLNFAGEITIAANWIIVLDKFRYSHVTFRKISVSKNSIEVDIKCVRNCLPRSIPGMPAVYFTTCKKCEWNHPESYLYRWKTSPRVLNITGGDTRYLTIENIPTTDFVLSVTVTDITDWGLGTASKKIKVATGFSKPRFSYTITPSNTESPFDLFDIDIQMPIKVRSKEMSALPVKKYIRIDLQEAALQFEVCSFTAPINKVALHFGHNRSIHGFVGVQTADLHRHELSTTIIQKDPKQATDANDTLQARCTTAESGTFDLTGAVAIAQEIYTGDYEDAEISKCFRILRPLVVGRIHSSRYVPAYKILYLFYMAVRHEFLWRSSPFYFATYLKDMEFTKDLIFKTAVQRTEDLHFFTQCQLEAIVRVFGNPAFKLSKTQYWKVLIQLRTNIVNTARGFLNLLETRGQVIRFDLPGVGVYMWWSSYRDAPPLLIDPSSVQSVINIKIPSKALDASTFPAIYGDLPPEGVDPFINVLVLVTDNVYLWSPDRNPNCGTVHLYVYTKTHDKRLDLGFFKLPIRLSFQNVHERDKALKTPMKVVKEDDIVADSNCIIFW